MKKIFIIMILLTGFLYPQYVIKDSVVAHATAIAQHAQQILNLEGGTITINSQQAQIDALTNQVSALYDSVNVLRLEVEGIKAGGVTSIPEPTAPTNLAVTADNDTAKILLTWTNPTSVYDSIYIYRDNVQITEIDSGIATYTDTGLDYSVIYSYRLRSIKRISGIAFYSDYTLSVSDTTFTPTPAGGGGGETYLYVSASATGSGDGSIGNPFTIKQATIAAVAGDTVIVAKGCYTLPDVSGGNLIFSNSGTFGNPIVFIGELADENPTTADSTNNTFINAIWNVSSGALSITGNYIELRKMIVRQRYTDRVTTCINVTGDNFTMDSVWVQYPENVSSSSYHTMITYGDSTHINHCYFYRGCRTVIWVRASYPNTCDGFLMENTTIDGYSNHYAIQCMPSTSTGVPIPKLTNGIIRNCVFKNSGYESALYIRNVSNYKIYNNVFVNGGGRYAAINLYSTDGATSEDAYDTQSIFANNTIYSTLPTGSSLYSPGTMIFYGLSNQNGWTIKNNLASFFDCTSLYRNGCALSNTPSGQDYDIDYNMIYNSNRSASGITSPFQQLNSCTTTSYTWTNWKARGFDTHSIIDTDPNFVNPTTDQSTWDFHLGSQRAGTDLSSWGITTDYNGVTRTNWTIGAFEYVP